MNSPSTRGSCLCGAITFGMVLPTKWVAHCHCTRCQRAHGAAFVTWVGVEASQVELAESQSSLRWYETSEGARRGFCATCGSPMFFRSPRWPGELHIARALFIDPLDREPQIHVNYDSHVGWVDLGDALPRSPKS